MKRSLAQDRRQPADHRQRHRRGAELVSHALAVAAGVLERRSRQRDHLSTHGRTRLAVRELRGGEDLAATSRLAHFDAHALGERLRLAGKPPAFRAPLRCQLAQFDARRRAELTGSQAHQALAARTAAGTVDGQCHRRTRYCGEERIVPSDLDRDANGLYEDLVHGWTSSSDCDESWLACERLPRHHAKMRRPKITTTTPTMVMAAPMKSKRSGILPSMTQPHSMAPTRKTPA